MIVFLYMIYGTRSTLLWMTMRKAQYLSTLVMLSCYTVCGADDVVCGRCDKS